MTVLMTRTEAAARLRVSVRTLDKRIAGGTGPAETRVGRRVLISEAALTAWIETQTTAPLTKVV